MKKLIVILLVLLPLLMRAQNISTFAGNGTTVYSGNGVPATSAGIPDPVGGTFDKYGNYYFADGLSSHKIRKIDTNNIITTVVGSGIGGFGGDNGPATVANLNFPQSVKLDSAGNIYVGDADNNRVRKVDVATGIITTIAGNGIATYAGDGLPATMASLANVLDICLDKFGNLYIADADNDAIRKVDLSGIITTVAGNGTPGYSGDNGPATSAQLWGPSGVVVDNAGNIYIADWTNNAVRKVDVSGRITTIAGTGSSVYIGDGIPATAAHVSPIKLALSNGGEVSNELYMADDYHRRILRIGSNDTIYSVAGNGISGFLGDGGPATASELNYPSGVSFDPCGIMYIPDVNNRRIRKVTFDTSCSLVHTPLSLNINTTKNFPVLIYPNPTYNQLQIDNITTPTNYNLHNIVGATIQHGILKAGSNSISLSALATGMYLLELIDDEGNRVVRKVVKE